MNNEQCSKASVSSVVVANTMTKVTHKRKHLTGLLFERVSIHEGGARNGHRDSTALFSQHLDLPIGGREREHTGKGQSLLKP